MPECVAVARSATLDRSLQLAAVHWISSTKRGLARVRLRAGQRPRAPRPSRYTCRRDSANRGAARVARLGCQPRSLGRSPGRDSVRRLRSARRALHGSSAARPDQRGSPSSCAVRAASCRMRRRLVTGQGETRTEVRRGNVAGSKPMRKCAASAKPTNRPAEVQVEPTATITRRGAGNSPAATCRPSSSPAET